jgi:predicted transcriptional regulator
MQSKLQELQEKLQAAEAEKRELELKYEEIRNACHKLKRQVISNLEQQQRKGEVCDIFISYLMNILHLYDGEL